MDGQKDESVSEQKLFSECQGRCFEKTFVSEIS